jgi:hypothetical protein
VCVHDFAATLAALEGNGFVVGSDQEAAVVDIEDRPGALGAITQRLADAEVNITLAYLATSTRLVIGPCPARGRSRRPRAGRAVRRLAALPASRVDEGEGLALLRRGHQAGRSHDL